MSKTDAAYMRAYRARKKLEAQRDPVAVVGSFTGQVATLRKELARVEDERDGLFNEVRHLKEELAKRPPLKAVADTLRGARLGLEALGAGRGPLASQVSSEIDRLDRYNSRPFTPVPKKGK